MSLPSITRATLYVPSARARPQVFIKPEKATSVKRLDVVLGKVHLPSWCFIVWRHGCNAHRSVYCLLFPRCVAADIYIYIYIYIHSSMNTFFKASLVGIQFTNNRPSVSPFLFPVAVKCWCGTFATMFSQAPRRDSQDLCRFSLVDVPSRW